MRPAVRLRDVEQGRREVDVRDLAVDRPAGRYARAAEDERDPQRLLVRAGTCRPVIRCWPWSQPLSEMKTISVFWSWCVFLRVSTSRATWSSTARSEPARALVVELELMRSAAWLMVGAWSWMFDGLSEMSGSLKLGGRGRT